MLGGAWRQSAPAAATRAQQQVLITNARVIPDDNAMQDPRALVDTPPVRAGFIGLHRQAMVVDRNRGCIGAMNLDLRSGMLHAELGVVVDRPAPADALAQHMGRDMGEANRWQATPHHLPPAW